MIAYIDMHCPHCRHPLRIRAEYAGRRVCCRRCDHTFVVRAATTAPAPGPDPPRSSDGEHGWEGEEPSRHGAAMPATAPPHPAEGDGWGSSPGMSHVGPVPGRRFGDYDLLDELSRSPMSYLCRARHVPSGRIVALKVEAKVVNELPSSLVLKAAPGDLPSWSIPGYRFIRKVFDGSMGRVYQALQTSVDRLVAIKVLRESRARNTEYIERFWREARLAARLAHPNVVTTLDAGEAEGHHYIIMEFIEGEAVQAVIDRGHVFEQGEAVAVMLDVAEALRHVHGRGVIHRDVKPANLMRTPDGPVKLIDLGLARSIEDDDWAASEAGMAVGTPEYISPEQVRGQTDVDARADIYSLGATLYTMVTGTVPHPGTDPREVMHKHVDRHSMPIPPDQHNDRLSEAMVALIARMMARNRDDRFPDLDELIAALHRLQEKVLSAQ